MDIMQDILNTANMTEEGFVIDLGDLSIHQASEMVAKCRHQLQEIAAKCRLMIRCNDREWEIKASNSRQTPAFQPKSPQPNWNLLGADFRRIHEFLIEAREQGLIVAITQQDSDLCLFTNDLLTPSRAMVHGREMIGYNYRESWKRDRNSSITDLNPQLEQLKRHLERDGVVRGYEYSMFRRKDLAHCEYLSDFYLCRDYMGTTVRIGVSRPQDYRVLSEV